MTKTRAQLEYENCRKDTARRCEELLQKARSLVQSDYAREKSIRHLLATAERELNEDWSPFLKQFYGKAKFRLEPEAGSLLKGIPFVVFLQTQEAEGLELAKGTWEEHHHWWRLDWEKCHGDRDDHGFDPNLLVLLGEFLMGTSGKKMLLDALLDPQISRLPKEIPAAD